MSQTVIPKVLVTKIGFDGHDRGSRVVAAARERAVSSTLVPKLPSAKC